MMTEKAGLFLKIVVAAFLVNMLFRSCAPILSGQHPLIGRPAPDFRLAMLKGAERNMTDYRKGQPAIILFWATWCPYCRSELTKLSRERDDFARKGIRMILVDVKESQQVAKEYIQAQGVPFDVFWDKDGMVARTYRITGFPTFFLIDGGGRVKAAENRLPENFEDLLLGSPVP